MIASDTQPPRPNTGRLTLLAWGIALAYIVIYQQAAPFLRRVGIPTGIFTFMAFFAWLGVIAISLFWLAIAVRWMLRRLFWRVGRRLFLSYVMIGLLPFILMTILLIAVCYMIAGVMSHAALRGERQATLGQMESWALEYGLTGRKPADALPSMEIHDTADKTAGDLPEWLRKTTFSGMVWRDDEPLLICSRQFPDEERTVVFVQPLDQNWARQLEDKGGMIVTYEKARARKDGAKRGNVTVTVDRRNQNYDLEGDDAMTDLLRRWSPKQILWADITALTRWETGKTDRDRQLVTFILNPITNLFQFYFGASASHYVDILRTVILSLVVLLMIIYMFAAMFAAVLIFSISRAVNRIEKGTKAVERGDFSYRIRMRPSNQLGEMAQSFDRMTESIASLLTGVAEKERLQSEIAIAASIQRNLLPREGPQMRGVSFSAHFEPTASIGGDYYDVFNIDKQRLAVAIGDVSGHGLSTGLVMAMVKAAMTTLVEEGADEESLFERLNELVYRSTERRAFMTLAFTIFDLANGRIRHTNAGHLYPYLLRDGSAAPISIESPSLPLGVREHIVSRTVELDLQEGDAIVYLSDGIIEAQNENGDPLGFDHLEALLGQQTDRSPSTIRDSILTAVAQHSGTRPADDDRTVMVLRFEQFQSMLAQVPELSEAAAV
jgi:serine phosphatase RsbU (regulator of sigma subunit)